MAVRTLFCFFSFCFLGMIYPLIFENIFCPTVWGGQLLKSFKGIEDNSCKPVGESWEVSAIPGKESVVRDGTLQGSTLTELVDEYREQLLGRKVYEKYGCKFPLLIKFIDAEKDLSIQVHPNDEIAKKYHDSFGKSEMWYVIGSKPGAKLYSGFKSRIDRQEYERRIADASICEVLASHQVKEGDVFYIPAGRVHAICSGILLAEIQQSSDLTYRIFDYNRPGLDGKPRELHTALAGEALDYGVEEDYRTHYTRDVNRPVQLVENKFFTVNLLETDEAFRRTLYPYDSFVVYMCLSGACRIRICSWNGEEPEIRQVCLRKGTSCLIPACMADTELIPENSGESVKLLEVYIDNKD